MVRTTPQGWRFLLLRAFNHWDFPKGMVEAGEEPLAAAIREVREETLITDLQFAWGEVYTETGPYSRGKVARYYIASTDTTDSHADRHRGARSRRAQRVPLGRLRGRRAAGLAARAAHRRLGVAAALRMNQATKQVVIVGAGFAGLNAAKRLRDVPGIAVTLLDRENHHLFQPLLYQVAMAALSPADIAVPIRSLFASARNIRVLKAQVQSVAVDSHTVVTDSGEFKYDYLLLASGSTHAYFGHEEWEVYAPGLKTLPQATEIRRRVLEAFEAAERDQNVDARRRHLTFVVVGGGPTGVELAGAIGEMSRYTLARDFRSIDPRQTRVILVEAGPRILPSFDEKLAARAMRDLESLGVQVWTNSRVTNVTTDGVSVGNEHVACIDGVMGGGRARFRCRAHARCAGRFGRARQGRTRISRSLGIRRSSCSATWRASKSAKASRYRASRFVAMQEGIYAANLVKKEVQRGAVAERAPFRYHDLGQMATIGRSRAIAEFGRLRLAGYFAWWFWLLVHIYRLSGFRNRLSVLVQWAWSYMTFGRGARLIVDKEWQAYPERPLRALSEPSRTSRASAARSIGEGN